MRILVTGDLLLDHHIYRDVPCDSKDAGDGRAETFHHEELGGAARVERLLEPEPGEEPTGWSALLGIERDPASFTRSYGVWTRCGAGEKERGTWRATAVLGYGPPAGEARPSEAARSAPDILVVDEAGLGFRKADSLWSGCLDAGALPAWVVWHTAKGLDGGSLWQRIQEVELHERTVLVVSASELRRAGFEVSRGLSWERSALDSAEARRKADPDGPLGGCGHLVVSFQGAGALWMTGARGTLIFDPASIEDDPSRALSGAVFGYQACLTAGIAWGLAAAGADDLVEEAQAEALSDGIRRGLQARRLLHAIGHGEADARPAGFRAARIRAEALRERPQSFASAELPEGEGSDSWTLLESTAARAGERTLNRVARIVASHGLSALAGMPSLRVHKIATVDRSEIESLRRLQRKVREYEEGGPQKRPLSLAVFGAPGSGKSTVVHHLAQWTMGKDVKLLEFNLAQFSEVGDLMGAYHQVRDAALSGHTPFVLWDEFDSQEYRWLRLLLAPMQDGAFQEGQVVHPIGKCVFVFAGGTSATYAELGPLEAERETAQDEWRREERAWRLAKGPDFKSRLHGTLDVLGPNPRLVQRESRVVEPRVDPTDVCVPVRRALFLRGVLKLEPGEPLVIEPELLDALLAVPRYTHGSRSLERIVKALRDEGNVLRSERLPPREDLAQDVQDAEGCSAPAWLADEVERRRRANGSGAGARSALGTRIEERVEEIALRIHAAYMELPAEVRSADVQADFERLDDFLKKSNRSAGKRIPEVLAAMGFRIVEEQQPGVLTAEQANSWLDLFLDLGAAREHQAWMAFHIEHGWKLTDSPTDPKDKENRRHPALVPWSELSEASRDKDRRQVRIYLEVVRDLGFELALA